MAGNREHVPSPLTRLILHLWKCVQRESVKETRQRGLTLWPLFCFLSITPFFSILTGLWFIEALFSWFEETVILAAASSWFTVYLSPFHTPMIKYTLILFKITPQLPDLTPPKCYPLVRLKIQFLQTNPLPHQTAHKPTNKQWAWHFFFLCNGIIMLRDPGRSASTAMITCDGQMGGKESPPTLLRVSQHPTSVSETSLQTRVQAELCNMSAVTLHSAECVCQTKCATH